MIFLRIDRDIPYESEIITASPSPHPLPDDSLNTKNIDWNSLALQSPNLQILKTVSNLLNSRSEIRENMKQKDGWYFLKCVKILFTQLLKK